jgi:hypothetical protein
MLIFSQANNISLSGSCQQYKKQPMSSAQTISVSSRVGSASQEFNHFLSEKRPYQ